MRQVPDMLVSAAAVQGMELLVTLAVGGAGGICCAEEVWVLGWVTDDALAAAGVAQWHFTCR